MVPSARADDAGRESLAREGRPDIWSWFARTGSCVWRPWSELGAAPPPSWAGHAFGAVGFDDPWRGPGDRPHPGVAGTSVPLAWVDSLHVGSGGDAAWEGFLSPLARFEVRRDRPPGGRARTAFGFLNGTSGLDEAALAIERGDTLQWVRIEAENGRRGAAGNLEDGGRHQWGVAGGLQRGGHRLDGAWAQRATAMRLGGDDEQAVNGDGGRLAYRHVAPGWSAGADYLHGWSRHESFGATWTASEREAKETRGSIDAELRRGAARWGVRLVRGESHLERHGDGAAGRTADETWMALRGSLPAGDGTLAMSLGAGHHTGVDRTEWAPTVQYAFADDRVSGRIVLERTLAPAWADLDTGSVGAAQAPFLQNTWRAGAEVGLRADRAHATLAFHVGRTDDRAIVTRAALEEQWLRAGLRAEGDRYDFGLLTLDGEWRTDSWSVGGGAFALARDASTLQRDVDPAAAARGFLGWGFRAFQNDLAVELRAEMEAVGARDVEALANRTLPGYVTSAVAVSVAIADAHVTMRASNLEDQPHEEVWLDARTGEPARGPGRSFVFALIWRLSN